MPTPERTQLPDSLGLLSTVTRHHLCARPGTIAVNKTSVVSIVMTPSRGRRPRQKAAHKYTISESGGCYEEIGPGKGRGAGLEGLPEVLPW